MCTAYYYDLADGDALDALILAIEFGDWKAFQALVSVQADINGRDRSDCYWTLLMHAVHEESINMVKGLVEAGADVNLQGADPDEFPLNIAAWIVNSEPLRSHRSQTIFDYLAPLTSPELRRIAEQTLIAKHS